MAGQKTRGWWQAPRRVADRIDDRRVSFLELFYDLVYVVIISEIAQRLSTHMDVHGLLVYGGMFAVVWWAWLNGSLYHNLHGNDDLRTRVFTFLQMIAVASMAVFAHGAVGEYSREFAISYTALQLILAFLWFATGVTDPEHRPLSFPYSAGLFMAAAVFAASAFVPEEIRYRMWFIATAIVLFGLQGLSFLVARLNPSARTQMERSFTADQSEVERFGLFTIIVLGEVVVGVVRGVIAHDHLDQLVGATAALGMLISVGLWWNYFDFLSMHKPRPGRLFTTAWMYLNLPLTLGIAAAGAAVLNAVKLSPGRPDSGTRFILVGSVALTLFTMSTIGLILEGTDVHIRVRSVARWFTLASAAAAVGLGFTGLPIVPLLALLVALLLIPVAAGFFVWVRHQPDDAVKE